MATRRYHKKRVSKHSKTSRKMHGGKIDRTILGTKIEDILTTINGAKRTKDNILVYTITTSSTQQSDETSKSKPVLELNERPEVTWTFNNSNLANVGKTAAYLGSFLGATRTVLEATKDNISRIYNGKVDLSQITTLPKKFVLTPTHIHSYSTETMFSTYSVEPALDLIQFKTAIFYFYLYLQD